ncbi:hypothetical protein ACFLSP_02860 [Bacteroidota bacterium]
MNKESSVLITEHRFSSFTGSILEKRTGRFCVQFVTFNQSLESREILLKWKQQCIEWCYNRYEDDKFGDQKYLDVWPEQYNNVHILEHKGGGLAPWNIRQYKLEYKDEILSAKFKKSEQNIIVVFYHFQYLKFMKNNWIDLGWLYIPGNIRKMLYIPYLKVIFDLETRLTELTPDYQTSYKSFNQSGIKEILKMIFKKTTKFNIIRNIYT